ncbi:MAG TPA: MerR family transcriptional regulator [Gaiellaceae bacterium]|nr:MerR family transcriptional regulator [Gaiellaceae bacterium]
MESTTGYLRIGELSRRVGVPPELLRAWESRYGLLSPARSRGGFRLYSDEDVRRIAVMRSHLASGLSAAEAARLALASPAPPAAPGIDLEATTGELRDALDRFDDVRANSALDRLLAAFGEETVLAEVVLPYLHELGDRWETGAASIAQEHFASNVVRGRLAGLARGWGQGIGPRALLACAPGELHDLALVVFGLAVRARGWRVTYLGPDTPLDTLADTADALRPTLVVVTATVRARFRAIRDELRRLGERTRLAVAGAGATGELARAVGALHLAGDPISEAERVAREVLP